MQWLHDNQFQNGEPLADATASGLITVITSTSLIPSTPSCKHLYPAQASLFKIPTLAQCRKLIVFDGLPIHQEHRRNDYALYKEEVTRLTHTDSVFSNTQLHFCTEWKHLAGGLKEAMGYVTTPFVFLHQHDCILIKEFDIKGCMLSMMKNPNIKHIHLTSYPNSGCHSGDMQTSWDGPVDSIVHGGSSSPLTRCFGWSDYCQVTTTDYLLDFVLPKCGHGFMESFLHAAFKEALQNKSGSEIDAVHDKFGTYLYGGVEDGIYVHHSDGARR